MQNIKKLVEKQSENLDDAVSRLSFPLFPPIDFAVVIHAVFALDASTLTLFFAPSAQLTSTAVLRAKSMQLS